MIRRLILRAALSFRPTLYVIEAGDGEDTWTAGVVTSRRKASAIVEALNTAVLDCYHAPHVHTVGMLLSDSLHLRDLRERWDPSGLMHLDGRHRYGGNLYYGWRAVRAYR